MTSGTPRTRAVERLAALRVADEDLDRSLEGVVAGMSVIPPSAIDPETLEALVAAVRALHEPLSADLDSLPAADGGTSSQLLGAAGDGWVRPSAPVSEAVQAAYVALGRASGAVAALFTTSRLMCEDAVCDQAETRMKTYAGVAKALNALLPQALGWELREEGLPCQCICPMCGLGACGCIWASMHTIDVAWGGPGFPGPFEQGIPLRSPPRPGSQLAAAGVRQWDRVLSVDGEGVGSPVQLQAALRRHALGEEVRLGVGRDGEAWELTVRHVSDWP